LATAMYKIIRFRRTEKDRVLNPVPQTGTSATIQNIE